MVVEILLTFQTKPTYKCGFHLHSVLPTTELPVFGGGNMSTIRPNAWNKQEALVKEMCVLLVLITACFKDP